MTEDPTYDAYVAYALYDAARDAMWPRWNSDLKRYEGVGPDIQRAMTAFDSNPSDENRNHVADLKRKQEAMWRDAMKLKSKAEAMWQRANLGSWIGARANHNRWVGVIDHRNAALRAKTRAFGETAAKMAREQGKPDHIVQRLAQAAWDAAFSKAQLAAIRRDSK
jgi:hypothetical protein